MKARTATQDEAPADNDGELAVEALLAATPVLVGVAARAVEQLDPGVSLSGFRLLLALAELGTSPSVTVADHLGSTGSSVTRLADQLEESGHLVRRRERPNRSVVRLELTVAGRELVERVLTWRRAELASILARLPADAVRQIAAALESFVAAAGSGYGPTPIELRALPPT